MQSSPTLWVSIALSLLCIVLVVVLWVYAKNIKTKLMQSVGLIDELYKLNTAQSANIEKLKSQILKNNKVSKALQNDYQTFSHEVQDSLNKVSDTVERLEEQDPALKMYSKASKLVEQGAAMEDIIEASGLPRAEVEVLMSLHAKSQHLNK
jgi:seryl-tRNA synthetase